MAVEYQNLDMILITEGIDSAVLQNFPLEIILDRAEALLDPKHQSPGGLIDVSPKRSIHNALRAAVLDSNDDIRQGELYKLAVNGRIA